MKSLKLLPLDKRDKATVKQLLEALEVAEKELEPFKKSPLVKSYLTLYYQLEDWNEQLTLIDGKGKIDLFSDKDDKSFERTFKYFAEMRDMIKNLSLILSEMMVEEKKEAETHIEESSVLEKHLLSKKP